MTTCIGWSGLRQRLHRQRVVTPTRARTCAGRAAGHLAFGLDLRRQRGIVTAGPQKSAIAPEVPAVGSPQVAADRRRCRQCCALTGACAKSTRRQRQNAGRTGLQQVPARQAGVAVSMIDVGSG
jgi:hypothetical protein